MLVFTKAVRVNNVPPLVNLAWPLDVTLFLAAMMSVISASRGACHMSSRIELRPFQLNSDMSANRAAAGRLESSHWTRLGRLNRINSRPRMEILFILLYEKGLSIICGITDTIPLLNLHLFNFVHSVLVLWENRAKPECIYIAVTKLICIQTYIRYDNLFMSRSYKESPRGMSCRAHNKIIATNKIRRVAWFNKNHINYSFCVE